MCSGLGGCAAPAWPPGSAPTAGRAQPGTHDSGAAIAANTVAAVNGAHDRTRDERCCVAAALGSLREASTLTVAQ